MGTKPISTLNAGPAALRACLCAGALAFGVAFAIAQDAAKLVPPPPNPGFLASIGRWFEETGASIKSGFSNAGSKVQNLGHEAGVAAKTTVETAKDAAGAVARIPGTRVITGHEKCVPAPNGAPDCLAAATIMCKAKGFESGKSLDMTTAEVCPAQVLLSGRNSGGDCRTETFVSRVLCQ